MKNCTSYVDTHVEVLLYSANPAAFCYASCPGNMWAKNSADQQLVKICHTNVSGWNSFPLIFSHFSNLFFK